MNREIKLLKRKLFASKTAEQARGRDNESMVYAHVAFHLTVHQRKVHVLPKENESGTKLVEKRPYQIFLSKFSYTIIEIALIEIIYTK